LIFVFIDSACEACFDERCDQEQVDEEGRYAAALSPAASIRAAMTSAPSRARCSAGGRP